MLLTLHARLGRWLQTGGHIESTDPTLEAAADREAHEESGLADLSLEPSPLLLSKHEVPCGPVRPTYHLDVQYLVLADHLVSPDVGDESLDVRWFAHDQLPEVDHSVAALVAGCRRTARLVDGLVGADSVARHRRDVERAIEDGDEKTALITGGSVVHHGASRKVAVGQGAEHLLISAQTPGQHDDRV